MQEINTQNETLAEKLKRLHKERKKGKQKIPRGGPLTKSQRKIILAKTNSTCHICGQTVTEDNFQADHVKAHIAGGSNNIDNFLPSCSTCNNYRWHYLPEEIQLILKIGVWTKTQIENETSLGKMIAEGLEKHTSKRINKSKIKSF